MRARWASLLAPLLLWAIPAASTAGATETTGSIEAGTAIALHGRAGSVPACSACHGASGAGRADIGAPRLAALDATYLARQLSAFGGGTRQNAIMSPIAKTLDSRAMADVSAYYASLPAPHAPRPAPPSAAHAAGQTIALRGKWSAKIPPCASCHGTDGLGVGAAFPPLAGQPDAYIAAQLAAWRAGTRKGDPLGLMTAIAARLDAGEIAAVAAYYAALPSAPAPQAETP